MSDRTQWHLKLYEILVLAMLISCIPALMLKDLIIEGNQPIALSDTCLSYLFNLSII